MAKVRKVDFSPDEFLVGIAGMKAIDIAVYWVTCALQMSSSKPVHVADSRLFSIIDARAPDIKAALTRLVAAAKLQRTGDELENKRVRKEIKNASKRIRNASEAGVKSGEARRRSYVNQDVTRTTVQAAVERSGELSPSPPSPPSHIISKPEILSASGEAGALRVVSSTAQHQMPGFTAFYAVYPRKKKPREAEKAYSAALKRGADPNEILAGATRYVVERRGQDPKFTEYPATWLNGDGWKSEPDAAPQPQRKFSV